MTGPRALLVDFGGVLTTSLGTSFAACERDLGLPDGMVIEVIAEVYSRPDGDNPIMRFERGEATPAEFEAGLGEAFAARGVACDPTGLASKLFAGTQLDEPMWDLVGRARAAGITTCLLSNSWGTDSYPMQRLESTFDHLVISGAVGLRKPDPAIFHLAAETVGLAPAACAFLDDFDANVAAANALGMFGVLHTRMATTAELLVDFLGVDLAPDAT